jgi:predicted acylesterase/phospholipase RssA
VLNRILKAKENEENGVGDARSRRRFEIYGLSGTSAGALNAFIQLHKSQRITQRVPELRVSKARIA